jgi:hypothetical protein
MGRLTYEEPGLVPAVVAALREFIREDEIIIWRCPFRWHRYEAGKEHVIPNAYESHSLRHVCDDRSWTLVHDFEHIGIVKPRAEENDL